MANREPKTILGFQFEPERKRPRILRSDAPGSDSDSSWAPCSGEDEGNLRTARCNKSVEAWCKCKNCKIMKFEVECKCCHKLQSQESFRLVEDSKCIVENENFKSIVLLKENLWAVLVGIHDKESTWLPKNRHSVPNRTYRFAAYRQFTWWVHNKGMKGVRRVIPACVVSKIREEFPSPDGVYTGFIDGEHKNEIDITWLYRESDIESE